MSKTKRPNVLCIISDDTDPFNLGCYGGDEYLTPHLDRLAAEGMQFMRSHAVAPVCTPARYSYLTGHYPGRCPNPGFRQNNPTDEPYNITWNTDLAVGQANLATMFRDAGYTTGYVGKFHCGRGREEIGLQALPPNHDPHDPDNDAIHRQNQQQIIEELHRYGWDDVRHATWGNLDFNPAHDLPHNLEWTTEGARRFLDDHAEDDQPFLLYCSYHTIHGPKHGEDLDQLDPRITAGGLLDGPPDADQPSRASVLQRLKDAGLDPYHRNVGALWMDDGIGSVLRKLDELGLTDETIVIYKADHGKFGKATVYQDGSHVPLIWRWPGRIEPGTRCRTFVQHIDFLPTLLELCGIDRPADYRFDGESYADHLLNGATRPLRDVHYNEMGLGRSVQTERWKLVSVRYRAAEIARMKSGKTELALGHLGRPGGQGAAYHQCYYDADQLYEIQQDRGEQMNLVDHPDYADVLAEMKGHLQRFTEAFEHPYPLEPDPFQRTEQFRGLVRAAQERDRTAGGKGTVFGDRYW